MTEQHKPQQGVAIDHNDIRWRVSNTWMKGDVKMGMLVGYIDARTCMEALDTLDPQWSAVHGDPIIIGTELVGVPCALTVNGVTRSDVGMPSSQDPIKGAYSDALKRAAVHFDIGRELYELPKIAVECDVDQRSGKVKGPKATPVFHNGRWEIDRKYGWVRYDRDPDEQPEPRSRGERPTAPQTHAGVPASAPVDLREQLARSMKAHGVDLDALERIADELGVPKGAKATDDQLRAMIARIESPPAAVPATAAEGADVDRASAPDEAQPEGSPLPPAAPSIEDVLAITGGELVPPRPGSAEYRALPNGSERAAARAYWDRNKEPQQETLAAALGSPVEANT